jgi:hypothetical protein
MPQAMVSMIVAQISPGPIKHDGRLNGGQVSRPGFPAVPRFPAAPRQPALRRESNPTSVPGKGLAATLHGVTHSAGDRDLVLTTVWRGYSPLAGSNGYYSSQTCTAKAPSRLV